MTDKSGTKRVVLATRNLHKAREIRRILDSLPLTVLDLKDFPQIPKIAETGSSFRENALIKARTVFDHTGLWALGDDSGLEVAALNGAPGIFSARFAGPQGDYRANNTRLLNELKGFPPEKRSARFCCTVAIVGPRTEKTVEGVVPGRILSEPRGQSGFGYDPLFVPEGYQKTFAELGDELKNQISHRAIAFRKAAEVLQLILRD